MAYKVLAMATPKGTSVNDLLWSSFFVTSMKQKTNLAVDNIGVEVSYTSNNNITVQSSSKYFDLTDMETYYKTSI